MIQWWKNFRKNREIKKIIRELPHALRKNYHKRDDFTFDQIRATYRELNFNPIYIAYAYAAFFNKDAFNAVKVDSELDHNYTELRNEIGELCFSGNPDFCLSYSSQYKGYNYNNNSDAASPIGNEGEAFYGYDGGSDSGCGGGSD